MWRCLEVKESEVPRCNAIHACPGNCQRDFTQYSLFKRMSWLRSLIRKKQMSRRIHVKTATPVQINPGKYVLEKGVIITSVYLFEGKIADRGISGDFMQVDDFDFEELVTHLVSLQIYYR